jgi:hypothetical protein
MEYEESLVHSHDKDWISCCIEDPLFTLKESENNYYACIPNTFHIPKIETVVDQKEQILYLRLAHDEIDLKGFSHITLIFRRWF